MPKQDCKHSEKELVKMPEGYVHYAKNICASCKKFINWEKNPATTKKYEDRREIITKLLTKVLTDSERSFLTNIISLRTLSDKQQAYYDCISKKYKT